MASLFLFRILEKSQIEGRSTIDLRVVNVWAYLYSYKIFRSSSPTSK